MIKKILIIALNEKWVGISRLPSGLDRAGFDVYALCPRKSYLAHTKFLKKTILYPTLTYSRSKLIYFWVVIAFILFNPDFVIPGDEDAILAMQRLSNIFFKVPFLCKISKIIRLSLPPKEFDELLLSKSHFQKKCLEWGLRTPENIVIEKIDDAFSVSSNLHYPVMLKYDVGYGGSGVYICKNKNELIKNLSQFQSVSFFKKIKNVLKGFFFISIFYEKSKVSIQQYIKGVHGQVPFCAKNGNIFAHNLMVSLRTFPSEAGATTVSRGIENKELDYYVSKLVKKTNYTGFGSLEFILEESSGVPFVIELNPRPTPTCHFSNEVVTNDLCDHLFKGLNLQARELGAFKVYTLAMFPGEMNRNPNSHFLTEAYHDIPLDDIALLRALEMN